jgi:hypothetical protein
MIERAPRLDVVTLVVLTPFGTEDLFTAYSVNLSEDGMLVRSPHKLERGAVLEFATATFAGECEVMWAHDSADGQTLAGMHFTSLGSRAHQELDKLLAPSPHRAF